MVFKTALIIAGGKGTRLEEHTEDLPKPLVLIAGKPILERIIGWLKKEGVNQIILGVAYKKEMIKNHFGNGENFGVRISYVEHDENGGTEDAFKMDVEQAFDRKLIKEKNFYAMNGDQITDLSLEKLAHAHLSKNAIVTLTTINLKTNFGMVKIGEDGRVVEFKEKGEVPDKVMNAGIYVFNKDIKEYLQGGNIEENAFKKLIKDNKIYSFHHHGKWLTVNDKRELEKAEEFLKSAEN